MSALMADVGTAMRDMVHGTQGCFRAALDALSRPGRICTLPVVATAGLQVPGARDGKPPMAEATAALLLTLLDAECTVRLHGTLGSTAAQQWLRFHTGVREALPGESASFTVVRGGELEPAHWRALDLGSDEAPQRGATLVVEVSTLAADDHERFAAPALLRAPTCGLVMRGPGIESQTSLTVTGVAADFWRHRIALQSRFPLGFELFLTSGRWIAAVPRSTTLALES